MNFKWLNLLIDNLFQVFGMCFVRKGLDKIFIQEELKWLDDIMFEVYKRVKEDELKRQDKDEVIQLKEESVRSCFFYFVILQEMVVF